jgi:hypothetical protein
MYSFQWKNFILKSKLKLVWVKMFDRLFESNFLFWKNKDDCYSLRITIHLDFTKLKRLVNTIMRGEYLIYNKKCTIFCFCFFKLNAQPRDTIKST